jgi:Ca-activated chloride channel family protein
MIVLLRFKVAVAALPLLAALCPPALAFQTPIEIRPRLHANAQQDDDGPPESHLRLDTSLVMVGVQATRSDEPVLDLTIDNFRIFENGNQQNIRYFAQEDAPVSIGILLDASGSMTSKKQKAAEAAAAFFRMANADDEFFLIKFDDKPHLRLQFTADTNQLNKEIHGTKPFGRTALYDAVHMGLDLMKRARYQRKALVIVSDGGDNRSRMNLNTVKNRAAEAGIPIYSLGIFDPTDKGADLDDGPEVLDLLAAITGGRHFPVRLSDLEQTCEQLGKLLRNEYILGYQPANDARDGTYRRITLEIDASDGPVALSYRKGYYAPNQ